MPVTQIPPIGGVRCAVLKSSKRWQISSITHEYDFATPTTLSR
jgi:hypothetical protein